MRGTATRSAVYAASSPSVTTMSKPSFVVTGPGSAATTWKSNTGPPCSLRSMPNTSQMTPNSNGRHLGKGDAGDGVEHDASEWQE